MARSMRLVIVLALALGVGCSSHVKTRVFGEQVSRPGALATLSGIVHDSHGVAKPDALVVIDGNGGHRQTVTDADGAYRFTALPAGAYELVVRTEETATTRTGDVVLGGTAHSSRKTVILHEGANFEDATTGA